MLRTGCIYATYLIVHFCPDMVSSTNRSVEIRFCPNPIDSCANRTKHLELLIMISKFVAVAARNVSQNVIAGGGAAQQLFGKYSANMRRCRVVAAGRVSICTHRIAIPVKQRRMHASYPHTSSQPDALTNHPPASQPATVEPNGPGPGPQRSLPRMRREHEHRAATPRSRAHARPKKNT